MENKSSLVDFLHNLERALKEYRHNELMSDFKSFYSKPVLTSALQGYEHQASNIFTRKKFDEVKSEIDDVAALNVIERSVLGSNVMLKINRFKNPDYVVLVCIDKVHSNFLCNCRQFQRTGIPCSHTICAMKYEHIDRFPNSLICKRWTKSAKADFISIVTSEESDTEQCAERSAAEDGNDDKDTEVEYSDQAVLANLDWGIEALEEAKNTYNMETKLARLDYAEKMLQVCAMLNPKQKTAGVPNSYLSVLWPKKRKTLSLK